MNLGDAFRWAQSRYRSRAPRILALLLGWVGAWVVLEFLVVGAGSAPGRPIWATLHLAYFWGTAYFEAAILREALSAVAGEAETAGRFFHHRVAFRFFALKAILLPAALVGTALLVLPGLYCAARFGPAFFFVVQEQTGTREALALSREVTTGKLRHLMLVCAFLLVFNLLGAAVLGLGLLVTLPMSALIGAHVFRAIVDEPDSS